MIEQTHRYSLSDGYKLHWYEIKSVLGRGGNGITYLARDRNLDRLVAIKEYLPIDCASRDPDGVVHPMMESCANIYYLGLTRFLKEARTLAKFVHPNIVRVHSVFEENNSAYMVMEYEQGQELGELFKKRENITEQALLDIFVPIMDGLLLVHQSDFIHRDIKPANIYIRKDQSPVLLDFGSARQSSNDLTRTLTVLATYGYAPFEQYDQCKAKQGPWSDIYSLGATIYYGVTGDKPVDSLKRAGAIIGGSNDLFTPLTKWAPEGYSEHFLLAVDNALLFHPKDRPQDILQWLDMLLGKVAPPPLPKNSTKHSIGNLLQKRTKTNKSDRKDQSPAIVRPQTKPSSLSTDDLTPLASHDDIKTVSGFSAAMVTDANSERSFDAAISRLQNANQNHAPAVPKRRGYRRVFTATLSLFVVAVLVSFWVQHDQSQTTVVNNISNFTTSNRITTLLDQADRALATEQYIKPETNNAVALYTKVLEIDPDNQTAKEGIETIVGHFTQKIQALIEAGNLVGAEEQLQNMDSIALKSTGFLQLRLLLRKARQKQSALIKTLLTKGQKAFKAGNIVAPEKDNALQLYWDVLKLEPDNPEAHRGLQLIHDYYVPKVSQYISAGEIEKAKVAIAAMRSAVPDSKQAQFLSLNVKKFEENNQKIARLLHEAEADKKAGHYIEPAENNALHRYRQVLILDKNNKQAKQGIDSMVRYYESQFYIQTGNNNIPEAEKSAQAIALISPNSPLRKKLRSDLEKLKQPLKPELEVINDLIYDFKQSFETSNRTKLRSLSEFTPGRQEFLDQFFEQYLFFKLEISDFAYITNEHRASALVSLIELVNTDGDFVKAGSWNKFLIQIAKNDKGKWKVHW